MRITFKMIDPQLRWHARFVSCVQFHTRKSFEWAQALLRCIPITPPREFAYTHQTILRQKDQSPLNVCVYTPHNLTEKVPGILWLHGGGYAGGKPQTNSLYYRLLAHTSPCIIVAPEYRLSLEAPYPAAFDDGYETLLWMKTHADSLGIRDDQLFVMGDSAGAGLAIAVTLRVRDTGEVQVAFQMPLYPMIDDRMDTPSMRGNNAPVWDEASSQCAWDLYLNGEAGKESVSVYAAPAREKDLSGLPPTYTFIGDLDPFRDETLAYVDGLRLAGVSVDFSLYKGCFHCFEQLCPRADISKQALKGAMRAFSYAAKHYFAPQISR